MKSDITVYTFCVHYLSMLHCTAPHSSMYPQYLLSLSIALRSEVCPAGVYYAAVGANIDIVIGSGRMRTLPVSCIKFRRMVCFLTVV